MLPNPINTVDPIHWRTVDLLLASVYWKSNGTIHKFLYGPPGAPSWQRNLGVEIQYSRRDLLDAALYVRKYGPNYIGALPMGEIERRLTNFLRENYWYLSQETFGQSFSCSFGERVSARPKAQLAAAIAKSKLFAAVDVLRIYPLVPVCVQHDFDSARFFLSAPHSVATKVPTETYPSHSFDGEFFPPFRRVGRPEERPNSWLGVRAPTSYAARKVKDTVLGALALTPHWAERYTFTGRRVFGGWCELADTWTEGTSAPHTPNLPEDIVISSSDHPWLAELARMLDSSDKHDRRRVKALEYFYRAWGLTDVQRFPILFMTLDAMFGEPSGVTQAVVNAIEPIMGTAYDYARLRRLFHLRSAVIHGGAPDVCESDNYHLYYVRYGEDPIREVELITARCLQSVIFGGLLRERPHTYADLIREKTGRIVT
jgi:hypothetical protein